MLQITDAAVDVLERAREAQDVPEDYGVRLFAHEDEGGEAALALAFASAPVEGDEVSEHGGTAIFVSSELAEPLGEVLIDAEETAEGVELTLRPQEEAE